MIDCWKKTKGRPVWTAIAWSGEEKCEGGFDQISFFFNMIHGYFSIMMSWEEKCESGVSSFFFIMIHGYIFIMPWRLQMNEWYIFMELMDDIISWE
jgi:hypothetical protein